MSYYTEHKRMKPVLRERRNDLFTIRFDPGEPFSVIAWRRPASCGKRKEI